MFVFGYSAIHPFTMPVKDTGGSELFTVEWPLACCVFPCKCCCYQELKVTSGGNLLGTITETCYFCIPTFTATDKSGNPIYKIHQPTCCGGMCVDCCTEDSGTCCPQTTPFWVFDANQANTAGDNAEHQGSVAKTILTEAFTDDTVFDVNFPPAATVEQNAILAGSAIFINALFFENSGAFDAGLALGA
jgi:Scramblase